jgi:hypothetical protein
MDIELMLQQEGFSILKNSPDLKKFLSKFVRNVSRATKSVAGGAESTTSIS